MITILNLSNYEILKLQFFSLFYSMFFFKSFILVYMKAFLS